MKFIILFFVTCFGLLDAHSHWEGDVKADESGIIAFASKTKDSLTLGPKIGYENERGLGGGLSGKIDTSKVSLHGDIYKSTDGSIRSNIGGDFQLLKKTSVEFNQFKDTRSDYHKTDIGIKQTLEHGGVLSGFKSKDNYGNTQYKFSVPVSGKTSFNIEHTKNNNFNYRSTNVGVKHNFNNGGSVTLFGGKDNKGNSNFGAGYSFRF